MSKINAIIAVICVFCKLSSAISVNEIVPIHISSSAIDNLVREIAHSIEPYSRDWSKEWRHPVSRESVEAKIIDAIDKLNSRVWADDLWTLNFLEALLWHYYYQLENEKGYFECDRITRKMQKNFPQRIEAFWLGGVNKIKAGRIAEGFALLDGLYTNANVPSAFINQYSHLSRICFIPRNYDSFIFSQNPEQNEFYFSPRELIPVLSLWESSETDGAVSFIFTEHYRFVENFQIRYPKLYNDSDWRIPLEIDENFLKEVRQPLLWQPKTAALHPAVYRITIDRSPQKMSLWEYMLSLVYKRFDFIEEIKPPLKKGGISARSKQYNVIRGMSGKSIIHTLYDSETFGNIEQFFTTENTLKGIEKIESRILITLETTQKIESKAIYFYIDMINGNFIFAP